MKEKRNPGAIEYFHRRIKDFDDIYRDDKRGLLSFLNKTIRASVRMRFDLAFEILGDLKGKSVLDIGCGSGRYMFRAAQNNADYIAGIDAAPGALDEARKIAADLGIEKRMKFVEGDFLERVPDRKFDVIFAVGYFDYIFNPVDHLKRMVEVSDGLIYASFPKRWNPLTVTRKIRLRLNGCPVRFYSKRDIHKILREVGIEKFELKSIFRDYILMVRK